MDDCRVLHLLPSVSRSDGYDWTLRPCEASEQVLIVESYSKDMSLAMYPWGRSSALEGPFQTLGAQADLSENTCVLHYHKAGIQACRLCAGIPSADTMQCLASECYHRSASFLLQVRTLRTARSSRLTPNGISPDLGACSQRIGRDQFPSYESACVAFP